MISSPAWPWHRGNPGQFGEGEVIRRGRDNVSLAEAPDYGKSIFEFAPYSIDAADYSMLSTHIHHHAFCWWTNKKTVLVTESAKMSLRDLLFQKKHC